jgi:hypothetical protein
MSLSQCYERHYFPIPDKDLLRKIDSCGGDILLLPRSLEMTPMEFVKTVYTYSLWQWAFKIVMITVVYLYHMWNELQLSDYQLHNWWKPYSTHVKTT